MKGEKAKKILYVFLHMKKTGGTTFAHHIEKNLRPGEFLWFFRYYGDYERVSNRTELKTKILSLSQRQRDKLKIIGGHSIYYGIDEWLPERDVRYVAFLREPIGRTISNYNFFRTRINHPHNDEQAEIFRRFVMDAGRARNFNETLDYCAVLSNNMFKFLADHVYDTYTDESVAEPYVDQLKNQEILNKLKAVLDKFYFIGLTERSDSDLLFLYGKLGIKKFFADQNISRKFFQLGPDDNAMLKKIEEKNGLDRQLYDYAAGLNGKFRKVNIGYPVIVSRAKARRAIYKFLHPLKHREWTFIDLLYQLSAALKKRSRRYSRLVAAIKNVPPQPLN